jgi:hypothetical protein
MKPLDRFVSLLAVLAVVSLGLSGPVSAVTESSATRSSVTAVVDFIPGDLDHMSCSPACANQGSGTAPFVPPIPVTTLAECEAYCQSVCHVSSCDLTTPPITSDTSGTAAH